MKRILSTLLLASAAIVATAKDIRTVVFTTTPQMHCESCENRIKKQLKFEKGVKNIETNVEQQRVTITYDADKTSPERLAQSMKKIKYEVRQLKSEKSAAKSTTKEKK